MRQITRESIQAFERGEEFRKSNMSVRIVVEACLINKVRKVSFLYLHGNIIAKKYLDNREVWISNAGWATNTTKERLNGISGVSIRQKSFNWYLNGNQWNGDWIKI